MFFHMATTTSTTTTTTTTSPYHERQSLRRCAVHSVNNLLQRRAFTPRDFDKICYELAPNARINPHKSSLYVRSLMRHELHLFPRYDASLIRSHSGLGNYDVNVMMSALAKFDITLKFFDKRKGMRGQSMALRRPLSLACTSDDEHRTPSNAQD